MGVVFSGTFGIGTLLYVSVATNAHLVHILFGNMLGVETRELWKSAIIALVAGPALVLKWKQWLLHSFDTAQASRLWMSWLHYGLRAALSLTIVVTLAAAGLILAIGPLIIPGLIVFLVVRKFSTMPWRSVLIFMHSMPTDPYVSFFLDSAHAPRIILVLMAVFIVAFVRRQMIARSMSMQWKIRVV